MAGKISTGSPEFALFFEMLDDRRASLQGLPSVDELMRGEMLKAVPTAKVKFDARAAIDRARIREDGECFRSSSVPVSLGRFSFLKLRRARKANGVLVLGHGARVRLTREPLEGRVNRKELKVPLPKHSLAAALRVLVALKSRRELGRAQMSDEVPLRRIMTQWAEELRSCADPFKMELMLHAIEPSVFETSMPLAESRSWACALPQSDLEGFHQRLRTGTAHIVGRICNDRLLLDVRCLNDNDLPQLALAVRNAC